MEKIEESSSPGSHASSFTQTTEDVARDVAAASATSSAVLSPQPSVVYSSKDEDGDSPLQKLQRQVTTLLKVLSPPSEVKSGTYNPEVLISQKRQWASFQLQHLDNRPLKEPTRLFESMVVVGLHPNCDVQALQRQYISRKSEVSGILQSALGSQNQARVEPNIEPQVLFVYPPGKQLPLKYKDLLSFCFPGGLEVHAVERTPSMSELNKILIGQEHLKQSDLSFVFRLQVAGDSTLYGCCVLVEEPVEKPSGLLSLISYRKPSFSSLRRHVLITRRCYCILSRLPYFELHFGVLHSIFTQERLEQLTKGIGAWNLQCLEGNVAEQLSEEGNSETVLITQKPEDVPNGTVDSEADMPTTRRKHHVVKHEDRDINVADDLSRNKQAEARPLQNAVLPLLRLQQYESSESSSSFQESPDEDRHSRSDIDDTETEEASMSGQEDPHDLLEILQWAKANNHGSLQIITEYYQLCCPARGTTLRFHPLEHLHPVEYHRSDETVLHIADSTIDLKSCGTSLEFAEVLNALLAEEEASELSIWAVACICGTLRLENVLTMFAGALLEKQMVVVCSNLGILSAIVLSIIPLIRPFRWQSLLMPVLPNDMLEFLDAPVPYVVGVKNKTNELQAKLTNVILVDANKNQVKSAAVPQLPKQKVLFSSLSPYHAKLVGESYLARTRPVYDCTDAQVDAAKGFLSVLRSYLDSLCSNLRSHTITNVQSNDDKVSLLLKDSFIDSFPYRERPFMKHFVDTQLFSVHTDLVLSFFQKA